MGGIADYSGSLVCEMTTREACHCAVQLQTERHDGGAALPREQRMSAEAAPDAGDAAAGPRGGAGGEDAGDVEVHIVSVPVGGAAAGRSTQVKLSLAALAALDTYEGARAYFAETVDGEGRENRWARYAAGCLVVLAIEKGVDLRRLITKPFRIGAGRARRRQSSEAGDAEGRDASGGAREGAGGAKAASTRRKLKHVRKRRARQPSVDVRLRRIAVLVRSDVPEGKGVSSSAAIEVSCMQAIAAALDDMRFAEDDDPRAAGGPEGGPDPAPGGGSTIMGGLRGLFLSPPAAPAAARGGGGAEAPLISGPDDLAHLAQIVETQVAGCPCGIMDQMTVVNGRTDHMLLLECRAPAATGAPARKARVVGHLPVPSALRFWGVDSGVRHDNSSTAAAEGEDYTSVRVGAFMGRRMIMARPDEGAPPAGDSGRFYLCDLEPYAFETRYASHLPERMAGAEFIERFGTHHDDDAYRYLRGEAGGDAARPAAGATITEVDPSRTYGVLRASRHPVYECMRTELFALLLEQAAARGEPAPRGARGGPASLAASLGALMLQSHLSYSSVGLGSAATDRLVRLALERGFGGAKITGGGSGGTVVIVGAGTAKNDAKIRELAAEFAAPEPAPAAAQPAGAYVFRGSSPGAAAFGVLKVKYTGFAVVRKVVERSRSGAQQRQQQQQQQQGLFCW